MFMLNEISESESNISDEHRFFKSTIIYCITIFIGNITKMSNMGLAHYHVLSSLSCP